VVAADIQQMMAEGSKMGLRLNLSKCEVISHPDQNIVDPTMSSFLFVSVADATLLGVPLFPGKVLAFFDLLPDDLKYLRWYLFHFSLHFKT